MSRTLSVVSSSAMRRSRRIVGRAVGQHAVGRLARRLDRTAFSLIWGGGPKVFVVGRNKTGTTTLATVLRGMGYRVGDQAEAELLHHHHYFDGNFGPIRKYCRTAEAFQDVPFSARGMVPALDAAFPGSKFILTVRGSAEEWYSSLTRFHGRLFGTDGAPPTGDELRAATYRTPGFMANLMRYYGTSDDDPYERDILIADYLAHNEAVRNYFAARSTQLLEVDVSHPDALSRLESFLERSSGLAKMPHENRTGP